MVSSFEEPLFALGTAEHLLVLHYELLVQQHPTTILAPKNRCNHR